MVTGLRLFMQSNRHRLNINEYESQTSKQNMNNNVIEDFRINQTDEAEASF